jgi:hypothetical protein
MGTPPGIKRRRTATSRRHPPEVPARFRLRAVPSTPGQAHRLAADVVTGARPYRLSLTGRRPPGRCPATGSAYQHRDVYRAQDRVFVWVNPTSRRQGCWWAPDWSLGVEWDLLLAARDEWRQRLLRAQRLRLRARGARWHGAQSLLQGGVPSDARAGRADVDPWLRSDGVEPTSDHPRDDGRPSLSPPRRGAPESARHRRTEHRLDSVPSPSPRLSDFPALQDPAVGLGYGCHRAELATTPAARSPGWRSRNQHPGCQTETAFGPDVWDAGVPPERPPRSAPPTVAGDPPSLVPSCGGGRSTAQPTGGLSLVARNGSMSTPA